MIKAGYFWFGPWVLEWGPWVSPVYPTWSFIKWSGWGFHRTRAFGSSASPREESELRRPTIRGEFRGHDTNFVLDCLINSECNVWNACLVFGLCSARNSIRSFLIHLPFPLYVLCVRWVGFPILFLWGVNYVLLTSIRCFSCFRFLGESEKKRNEFDDWDSHFCDFNRIGCSYERWIAVLTMILLKVWFFPC